MLFVLYSLGISILQLIIAAGSLFSLKLKRMRKGQINTVAWTKSAGTAFPGHQVVWMHCSSLGEFEQGRPVLEKLRKVHPSVKIVLSFFSPSGYEIRKNWEGADKIFYLPADTASNASKLIQKIRPDVFILVKYDFWWNLLQVLQKKDVPVFLTAALYKHGKYYFHRPFLPVIQSWRMIFTLRPSYAEGFKKEGILHVKSAGDPRVDRVMAIKENGVSLPEELKIFFQNKQNVVMYGSVWPEDILYVKDCMIRHPGWTHVVVPHDVSVRNIQKIKTLITLETDLLSEGVLQKNILIIDRVGLLSGLYKFAAIAYIGGGFGKGIHNTLEAAVHGIPVCFGPRYESFPEAVELVDCDAGFVISDSSMFTTVCERFIDSPPYAAHIRHTLEEYFEKSKGATDIIVTHIQNQLLHGYKKPDNA